MKRNDNNASNVGLKVVLYLRQSEKEQRLSIGQQRHECRSYAQSRGWEIVGEYIDNGRSGSKDIRKRKEFHRLIADSQHPDRSWEAVLCWDTARFGRLDVLTGAEFKQKLRKAGVWLETARGERIDWSTSMGRIVDTVKSEADHEYSINISNNVKRGRTAVVKMGYWATTVPYGYDRQYVEGETVKMLIPRREVFAKPRNWHVKPLPNEGEAKVVKWLFEQWRGRDLSLCGTIKLLRHRHITSPSGKPTWTLAQLKKVLKQSAYCGDSVIGDGQRTQEVHQRIGRQVKENAIPALVDRQTFSVVQKKVAAREGAEWRPRTDSGPLSGLLRCGHCGYTLARRSYTDKAGRTYNHYVCESALRRPEKGCHQWRVSEQEVLPHILTELQAAVDWEVLSRLEAATQEEDHSELDKLRQQVDRLAAKAERAAENVLLVDPKVLPAAQKALEKIQQEHQRAANALLLAERKIDSSALKEAWAATKTDLIRVGKLVLAKADRDTLDCLDPEDRPKDGKLWMLQGPVAVTPDALRDLLHQLEVQVAFFWGRNGHRNWKLTTGTLRAVFRPPKVTERQLEVSSHASRSSSAPASCSATWRTA